MTMPRQGFPPRVYEYTPDDLSGLSVDGMGPGQMAWVLSNKFTYILQPAVGVADGSNILDTLDDVSLQWVFINYGEPTSFPGFGGAPPSVAAASAAGAAATASRSDHTHLGVESVAIADANGGIQIVTGDNKNFTFQYVPISVANIAGLAAIPALHLVSGQMAFVVSTGSRYILQAQVGNADNKLVVATADDASRQWVLIGLALGGVCAVWTDEIDFTQVQTVTFVPVLTFYSRWRAVATPSILYTAKSAAVTVAPTLKIGSNASNDNINASQTPAGFTSQVVDTVVGLVSVSAPANVLDLSATGIRLQITAGATAAGTCKGRIVMQIQPGWG